MHGPYNAFSVGIAPTDTDNVALQSFNLDVDGNSPPGHGSLGSTVQRFGRLRIQPAFGSEISALAMPFHTQFFNGTDFVINSNDNCTPFASTSLILSNVLDGTETDGNILINGSASTTASIANNPVSGLSFSVPCAGNVCYTDVTADLSSSGLNRPYLRYDWDGNGTFDNNPTGRATLGVFEGSSVIIFSREPGFQ